MKIASLAYVIRKDLVSARSTGRSLSRLTWNQKSDRLSDSVRKGATRPFNRKNVYYHSPYAFAVNHSY